MQRKDYYNMDKSMWPDGPWKHEPDKRQWVDGETGFPCLIVRNSQGALCGYVGVSRSHPAYGLDPDELDLKAHGGVNYAAKCQENVSEADGICHVVEPGEDDDVWWFGFDCQHAWDYCPRMMLGSQVHNSAKHYRDFDYVTGEVRDLARQLARLHMNKISKIDRILCVQVSLRLSPDGAGYHVFMAGLCIGFLVHLSEGVRMSFLPEIVPRGGPTHRDFDSINAFLDELTTLHDFPEGDFK